MMIPIRKLHNGRLQCAAVPFDQEVPGNDPDKSSQYCSLWYSVRTEWFIDL